MIGVERLEDWLGEDVIDVEGEKAGKLEEVYLAGDEPVVAAVKTGGLRRKTHLVALEGTVAGRDYVRVPYSAKLVSDAPESPGDAPLDEPTLQAVAAHCGLRLRGEGTLEGSKARASRLAAAREAEERARGLEEEARRQGVESEQAGRTSAEAAAARQRAIEDAEAARREAERARGGG